MKIRKLEAVRGFAALYVIIHHFIGFSFLKSTLPPLARLPFRFGQEAVILFFLLSGFVIYLSSLKNPHLTFGQYFSRRFIRIYPLVLFSFILSSAIFWINGYHFSVADLKELTGNVFMLQDTTNKPGFIVLPFLGNGPLWSLSYEWWFYLMFYPIFVFIYKKQSFKIPSIYLALAISVTGWIFYLIHPNHIFLILAYFVIWWAGVATAENYIKYKDINLKNMLPTLASIFIMTCLSAIPTIQSYISGNRKFSQIMYPILPLRHFAFVLVVLLIGILWYKYKLILFDLFFDRFERFAAISYAIYILHFPIILLQISIINPYVTIIMKVIFVFILSYFMELKFQPFINKYFKGKSSGHDSKVKSIEST